MPKLTNAALKRLIKKTGRHADGGGLYFRVLGDGKSYWAFRYRVDGKAREMSLGPYPEVNLAEARDRHGAERTKVRTHKRDPIAEKRAAKQVRAGTPEMAEAHLRAHQAAVQERWTSAAVVRRANSLLRSDPRHAGRSDQDP
jgi:hypothetical protein